MKASKKKIKSGKTDLLGKGGLFTPLLNDFLEECLEGDLDEHLHTTESKNRRNRKGKKQVKTELDLVEISAPPCDRDSSFEPTIIEKR